MAYEKNIEKKVAFGNNSLPAERIFLAKKFYYEKIYPDGNTPWASRPIDFVNENPLYGRVDLDKDFIYPRLKHVRPIKSGKTTSDDLRVFNFVALAFEDLRDYIQAQVHNGYIQEGDTIANCDPQKSFVDLESLQKQFKEIHWVQFSLIYLALTSEDDTLRSFPLKEQIDSCSQFIKYYKEFLKTGAPEFPITLSGLLNTVDTSPLITGLCIEIHDEGYDADSEKQKFISSPNFNFFKCAARRFGFMLDRNVPWRLVADLSSKAMQEYMIGVPIVGIEGDFLNQLDKCRDVMRNNPSYVPDFFGYSQIPGFEDVRRHIHAYINEGGDLEPGYPSYYPIKNASTQQEIAAVVFSKAFEETWKTDMDYLAPYFLKIYNSYVGAYPIMSIYLPGNPSDPVCPLGKQITIQREPITTQTIAGASSRYGDRWSYKTFYNIRTEERRKGYSITQDGVNLRDATNIYDFRTGDSDSRYIATLRFIQNNFLGPLIDKFLNIRTVGDILS